MKEDYLWDKTGKDPEIKKLENALKTFRQTDPAPPALPVKDLAYKKGAEQNPPRYFQFAFASLASLAVVVFSIGAFLFYQNENPGRAQIKPAEPRAESATENNSLAVSLENTGEDILEGEDPGEPEITKTVFSPTKITKPTKIKLKKKLRKTIYKKAITPEIKREIPERKVELSELTAEERYAYDQLMKALAITSSNLRIVKDKVNGLEKPIVR